MLLPTFLVLYLIEILHQTTTMGRSGKPSSSCILSKFYIKPQQTSDHHHHRRVVSYRNSTSNHNARSSDCQQRKVVSYRNSTSNHNSFSNASSLNVLYLIEILHQTTTVFQMLHRWMSLYLIEILHQTTTNCLSPSPLKGCILSKFYIKPQHMDRQNRSRDSCILSKFYIKPQHNHRVQGWVPVVSYRNSTSNHN